MIWYSWSRVSFRIYITYRSKDLAFLHQAVERDVSFRTWVDNWKRHIYFLTFLLVWLCAGILPCANEVRCTRARSNLASRFSLEISNSRLRVGVINFIAIFADVPRTVDLFGSPWEQQCVRLLAYWHLGWVSLAMIKRPYAWAAINRSRKQFPVRVHYTDISETAPFLKYQTSLFALEIPSAADCFLIIISSMYIYFARSTSHVCSKLVDCIFETRSAAHWRSAKSEMKALLAEVRSRKYTANDVIAMRTFDRLLKSLPRRRRRQLINYLREINARSVKNYGAHDTNRNVLPCEVALRFGRGSALRRLLAENMQLGNASMNTMIIWRSDRYLWR